MPNYSIQAVGCQEILPRLSERMKYKTTLTPYVIKLYHNEYDKNNLLKSKKEKADNFKNCGSDIWLDNENHIVGANFCKQRLCPVCNYRRSTMMWHKIHSIASEFPENDFVLITLTVKNCKGSELRQTIDNLLESFARLRKRRTWQQNFIGFVRGLEITYNAKTETFHPHIHVLAMTCREYFRDKYVDIGELRNWWIESAQLDYFAQVDIKKVKNKEKAVAEVAKYAVKMSDILETEISSKRLKAVQTLQSCIEGRRLVSLGGKLAEAARKLKINIDDEFDGFTARKNANHFTWKNGTYVREKT